MCHWYVTYTYLLAYLLRRAALVFAECTTDLDPTCPDSSVSGVVVQIVRVPWAPGGARTGQRSHALVEMVDFFPTTLELLGLPAPTDEQLDGNSFADLFSQSPTWNKQVAFSQHPRCWKNPHDAVPVVGTPWVNAGEWECLSAHAAEITAMGMTMRTRNTRYTEWRLWEGERLAVDWSEGGLLAVEMYNHSANTGMGVEAFDCCEFVNLGYRAAHAVERVRLASALRLQFCPNCTSKSDEDEAQYIQKRV